MRRFSLLYVNPLQLYNFLLLLGKSFCLLGQKFLFLVFHHDALGFIVFVARLHHVLVALPHILELFEEFRLFLSDFVVFFVDLVL